MLIYNAIPTWLEWFANFQGTKRAGKTAKAWAGKRGEKKTSTGRGKKAERRRREKKESWKREGC